MKVFYTKLSPFEIAFYDVTNGRIVVDECFKGSDVIEYIIGHETRHARSKGNIDILQELERTPKWAVKLMRAKKPLSSFSFLIPITAYRYNRKTILSLDYSRVLMLLGLAFFFIMMGIVAYSGWFF